MPKTSDKIVLLPIIPSQFHRTLQIPPAGLSYISQQDGSTGGTMHSMFRAGQPAATDSLSSCAAWGFSGTDFNYTPRQYLIANNHARGTAYFNYWDGFTRQTLRVYGQASSGHTVGNSPPFRSSNMLYSQLDDYDKNKYLVASANGSSDPAPGGLAFSMGVFSPLDWIEEEQFVPMALKIQPISNIEIRNGHYDWNKLQHGGIAKTTEDGKPILYVAIPWGGKEPTRIIIRLELRPNSSIDQKSQVGDTILFSIGQFWKGITPSVVNMNNSLTNTARTILSKQRDMAYGIMSLEYTGLSVDVLAYPRNQIELNGSPSHNVTAMISYCNAMDWYSGEPDVLSRQVIAHKYKDVISSSANGIPSNKFGVHTTWDKYIEQPFQQTKPFAIAVGGKNIHKPTAENNDKDYFQVPIGLCGAFSNSNQYIRFKYQKPVIKLNGSSRDQKDTVTSCGSTTPPGHDYTPGAIALNSQMTKYISSSQKSSSGYSVGMYESLKKGYCLDVIESDPGWPFDVADGDPEVIEQECKSFYKSIPDGKKASWRGCVNNIAGRKCHIAFKWKFGSTTNKKWKWHLQINLESIVPDIEFTIYDYDQPTIEFTGPNGVGPSLIMEASDYISDFYIYGKWFNLTLTVDDNGNGRVIAGKPNDIWSNYGEGSPGPFPHTEGILKIHMAGSKHGTVDPTDTVVMGFSPGDVDDGYVPPVDNTIDPGIYPIDNYGGKIYFYKESPKKFICIHDVFVLRIPATLAFSDKTKNGYMFVRMTGVPTSVDSMQISPATIHELDKIYVNYNDSSANGPTQLNVGKHAIAVSFNPDNGHAIACKYYVRPTNQVLSWPLEIIETVDHAISQYPVQFVYPTSPWQSPFGVFGGVVKCWVFKLNKVTCNAVQPSSFSNDTMYLAAANTLYAPTQIFMRHLSTHQTYMRLRFQNPIPSVSSLLAVRYLDGPTTAIASFNPLDTDLVIVRTGIWKVKAYTHNGSAWVAGPESNICDYVNEKWSLPNHYPFTACSNDPDPDPDPVPTWWPFDPHLPGGNIDPKKMIITHVDQIHKRWYIPNWYYNLDDTDMSIKTFYFTIVKGSSNADWMGMISRIDGIWHYPDKTKTIVSQMTPPPANHAIMGFMPKKDSTSLEYTVCVMYRDRDGVLHTDQQDFIPDSNSSKVVIGSPADVNNPGGDPFLLKDFTNHLLPVTRHMEAEQPLGSGQMIGYQKIGIWAAPGASKFDLALNTKHNQGGIDRHFDLFEVTLPNAVSKLITDKEVCVWDDTDTLPDLIAALPTYLDNAVVIAREDFHKTRVYFVNPQVQGNPNVIDSVMAVYKGYAFEGTSATTPDDQWNQPDCSVNNENCVWYCDKCKVPVVATMTKTSQCSIDYDDTAKTVIITLVQGWLTAKADDIKTMEVKFTNVKRFQNVFGALDNVIIDPRGDLDLTLNSDLYGLKQNFTIGDIEVIFARDKTDNSFHLAVVELRGDMVAVKAQWDAVSYTTPTWVDIEIEPPTKANYYIYPRTDVDLGGELFIPMPSTTPTGPLYVDTCFGIFNTGVYNYTSVKMLYVAPILTTKLNMSKQWYAFFMPKADIEPYKEEWLLSPYVCFTNKYYDIDPTQQFPSEIVVGTMVVSKLLINMVRVHVFAEDGTWKHIGDYYTYPNGEIAVTDPTTVTKPTCLDFMDPTGCVKGFVPKLSDNTVLPANWTIESGEVETVTNGFNMYNREGRIKTGDPVYNNIMSSFALPDIREAKSIRIKFTRKPHGYNGFFTFRELDRPTRLFLWVSSSSDVSFQDIIPTSSGDMFYVAIPIREQPPITVHKKDLTEVDLDYTALMPKLEYDSVEEALLLGGTQDIEIIISNNHNKSMVWIYVNGILLAHTKLGAQLPWISEGNIGIHSHSTSYGLFQDDISNLQISYSPLEFNCIPQSTVELPLACEPAPATTEQSIHTIVDSPNVLLEVFNIKVESRFAYVHMDIINTGYNDGIINVYKGKTGGTSLRLLRDGKRVSRDELFEIFKILVLPDEALFVKVIQGSFSVRCSSIEELFV